MRNNTIDFYAVQKRKIALDRIKEDTNKYASSSLYNLYKVTEKSILENSSLVKQYANRFFDESINMGYLESANLSLQIMEKAAVSLKKNDSIMKNMAELFSAQLVPQIELKDLDSLKESVINSNIPKESKDKILESIKENKICSRVLNNNKSINKRYNMEKLICEKRHFPLYESVFDSCKLLDTYNIPLYGKVNIALEQLSYYLQKNAINYDKTDLVQLVTEYFLLSSDKLLDSDIKGIRSVLEENVFVSDNDIQDNAITHNDDNQVKVIIYAFQNGKDKTITNLKDCLDNLLNQTTNIIMKNFIMILKFLRHLIYIELFEPDTILDLLQAIIDELENRNLSREEIDKLITLLQTEISICELVRSRNADNETSDLYNKFTTYTNGLSNLTDDLIDYQSSLYPINKINSDIAFESCISNTEPQYLNEFFQLQSIITATIAINKVLSFKPVKVAVKAVKKLAPKTIKIFKKRKGLLKESRELDLDNITEDNRIDICLAAYQVINYEDINEVHDIMQEICSYCNNNLIKNDTSRVTYHNNSTLFEIHLEDATYLLLDESTNKGLLDYDAMNCGIIIESSEQLEKLYSILENGIDNYKETISNNILNGKLSADALCYTLETMQYTGIYNEHEIKEFVDNYYDDHYNDYIGNSKLANTLNTWESLNEIDDISIQIQALESVKYISEGLDINNIKLTIEGLKKKAKNMNVKAQESIRNMEASVNHFVQAVKKADETDRREAIIKGSVIPSFSKCIKMLIALAGCGVIAGPLGVIITAFGSLARSKHLDRQTRMMMMDEIDIELKVIEKEIQRAEESKNTKKYRQLLTFQKKLQREKQTLKYNAKTAQNMPDSTIGIGKD